MEINETDKLVLAIYKYVMPVIGASLVFVLGMIAKWMGRVSKDLSIIRVSLVRHEEIRDAHTKAIEKLEEKQKEQDKELTNLRIRVAGQNHN